MSEVVFLASEVDTEALGGLLLARWKAGDVVLLSGELGAGKTSLVRGLIKSLGWQEGVRSPTFNLIHLYDLTPPILHADLFRLNSASGLGLEEYFSTHLCLIEWPDRLGDMVNLEQCWQVRLEVHGEGRQATVFPPTAPYSQHAR